MINFAAFHFLRPWWLLGLLVLLLIWWVVRRLDSQAVKRYTYVAPHLQDALEVNRDVRRGIRPVDTTICLLAFLVVSIAGPTWEKEPSPWFAETAPLVIAIEVSDSMRSNDLQPTRLDRARFKVLDLIDRRTGSRTALIAYAGSAHVVMPPTKDLEVIKSFLESLDPGIMPVSGVNATTVLPLARELFGSESSIGTLLFVNDGFDAADVKPLAEFAAEPGAPGLAALVVGTEAGGVALMPDGSPVMGPAGGRLDTRVDSIMLRRVASDSGMSVVPIETGGGDLGELLRYMESNLAQADDPESIWRDEAWWLLWPAMLLILLGFRRGWTMQW